MGWSCTSNGTLPNGQSQRETIVADLLEHVPCPPRRSPGGVFPVVARVTLDRGSARWPSTDGPDPPPPTTLRDGFSKVNSTAQQSSRRRRGCGRANRFLPRESRHDPPADVARSRLPSSVPHSIAPVLPLRCVPAKSHKFSACAVVIFAVRSSKRPSRKPCSSWHPGYVYGSSLPRPEQAFHPEEVESLLYTRANANPTIQQWFFRGTALRLGIRGAPARHRHPRAGKWPAVLHLRLGRIALAAGDRLVASAQACFGFVFRGVCATKESCAVGRGRETRFRLTGARAKRTYLMGEGASPVPTPGGVLRDGAPSPDAVAVST